MTEQIKDLIEKIKQEGIKAAEEKAKKIEEQAKKEAEEIILKAKENANKITAETQQQLAKMEEKQKTSLVQAGRDLLLSLRREINSMLDRLLALEVKKILTPEAMNKIMAELIKGLAAHEAEMIITLGKEDLEALKMNFLAKLKEEVRKEITLKPSSDIRAGFTISFDAGKSCFEFTDKALAEYIGGYIRPKLNEILQAVCEKK